jgi:benzoate-CoA ligase family protein
MIMSNNAATFLVDRHVHAGNAQRTAIVSASAEITYGQLAEEVNRAANHLQFLGVAPEQRVILQLPDSAELVYFFLAAMKIGAVAVPVNTFCAIELLAFYLKDTRAPVLVTDSALLQKNEGATQLFGPFLKHTLCVDRAQWRAESLPVETFPVSEDDSALWLYTSGSTGTQKGVIHRHGALLSCARNYGQDVLKITAEDRCYSASKLFFAYGLGNSLTFPLSAGATTLLNAERSEPEAIVRFIREHRPTLFFAVPTVYHQLLALPQVDHSLFSGVRLCISAGESLPELLFYQWLERTGQPLYDGIGSTESMHIFCSNRPGDCQPGTSGRPVAGYELKIVDGNGAEVAAKEAGRLLVRGETLSKGYWNRDAATRAAFQGEWLATGDIYERTSDGHYRCLGREDDVFKSSGLWVSPGEIEQALLAWGHAKEAAVVGVRNGLGLSSAKAFVVLGDELGSSDLESVRRAIFVHLKQVLSKYKVPAEIEFLSALPKTATGKVSRAELRRRHAGAPRAVSGHHVSITREASVNERL